MVELQGRHYVNHPRILFKVGSFAGINFISNGLRFVFNNAFCGQVGVCRFTSRSTRFFIRVRRGLMFLFMRKARVIFMMFRREDVIMNQLGDIPVRISPITIIKGPSVFR